MTNRKNTKRALFASVISMLLCVTMLIGSTFAWFTDNVTAGVNTIEAGTLKIDLVDGEGNSIEGQTIGFVDQDDNKLWEPGARYQLDKIGLKNEGNLNAKYKVIISAVTGDVDLSKVIDVYEGDEHLGTLDQFLNLESGIKEGVIAPGETLYFGTLTLVMQTSAGNEYQGKKIENIAVTVCATQATVEQDSFDDQYDAGATYDEYYNHAVVTVTNQEELHTALNNIAVNTPTVINIAGDANTYSFPSWTTYSGSMKNKTIVFKANGDKTFDATFFNVNGSGNLVGANLTFDGVNVNFPENSYMSNGYTGMNLAEGKLVFKNATISGAQYLYVPTAEFINCVFENNADSYSVCTYGASDVTFTDCTFNTAGKAVLLYCDYAVTTNVTLTNCVFKSDDSAATGKAAVETGDTASASVFNITFTNCTQEGFDANNSTSPLWGNKVNSNMPTDRLNVIIDGADVY